MALLEARGVEATWRRSIAEALAVIDLLDKRIAPLHDELRPFAAPTRASCCCAPSPASACCSGSRSRPRSGDVARSGSPRELTGYAGLAPRSTSPATARSPARCQRPAPDVALGDRRSRPPSRRQTNPWLSSTCSASPATTRSRRSRRRAQGPIAAWHVRSREQPLQAQPARAGAAPVSASSRCDLAA
jgi:hypothetical protein